ncbi:AAA family ATPase [Pasteurella multocida]|uniref:AAA family ATPase n=1 Tax=Pasteurella multocida TaxID=747 RepID=UPI001CC66F78|nr:AAA family ATPase [Pasteurella multocida]MCZ2903806.1 AAA family ATPase [Pasteurella multocida]MEE3702155.1 AAA family ATPase [Pasteurella multocida]MEE3777831.1 AAA family ATPase [Pasteurella multocida]
MESLLSKILQKEIRIDLNYRGHGSSRIKIIDANTNETYIPSLDNLSAGQSTLLSIFGTIIQYSDNYDINKSIQLDLIEGIVVIDEIDLHLHIELQYNVLPELIKLFPKVQFIITTHSPFFVSGLFNTFNNTDVLLINMPSGNVLSDIYNFDEFKNAYNLL